MRLLEAQKDRSYRVVGISAGCHARDRLLKLGLVPGVVIHLKRIAPLRGPLMVNINGSDVVIGRGIASKIEVEEYP